MNSSFIGQAAERAVSFLFLHFRGGFDAFSAALDAVVKLLQDTLAEEKATDEALTELAESAINLAAV